ncbi:MAG: hypothetical protein WAZ18_01710 [Alphaproteobacteria bacterium]
MVKAAPQLGDKHGETVCTAAITRDGHWVRLYPITFRSLDAAQQFRRWDVVKYQWRTPKDDARLESRRVEHQSLAVVGTLPEAQRFGLIDPMVKTSLVAEREAGRSFAFIRPTIKGFIVEEKSPAEYEEEREKFDLYSRQADLFMKPVLPYKPCPYRFKYKYIIADGEREGTCQDWETEATYFQWERLYGKEKTLEMMKERWGHELPAKGLLFAMGTHSRWPDTWLINGIVQLPQTGQMGLGI